MICPKCGGKLWQENTYVTNSKPHIIGFDGKDLVREEEKTLCDNWHCKKCLSVFTNKELYEQI